MDELEASGQLARLLASGAHHCEQICCSPPWRMRRPR
jgi:hypothetical protein